MGPGAARTAPAAQRRVRAGDRRCRTTTRRVRREYRNGIFRANCSRPGVMRGGDFWAMGIDRDLSTQQSGTDGLRRKLRLWLALLQGVREGQAIRGGELECDLVGIGMLEIFEDSECLLPGLQG